MFKGFTQYWRLDLLAGFSVALVALPLSIGIAIAMDLPVAALMAGIIATMIGGVFATFIRSGNVSINGPSPALIGVVIAGMSTLGKWEYLLAAFICAGILQLFFGVFRLGILADFIPSAVVKGMMAAIGVIILGGQFHTGLGVEFAGETDLDNLLAIPRSLLNMNPLVAIIFFNSLLILAYHPYSKNNFIKYVPAPIWILLSSIPLYMLFQYLTDGQITMFGKLHELRDDIHLVTLPENVLDGFNIRPNFAKIKTLDFWVFVFSVFLISTIESLGSTKAIDKMDPLSRKTNLNKDISAMGISTVLSGIIGGLPVIAVIARSSVNINHGAKTRFSNLVHGAFVLLIVFFLAPYIQLVPKAALMAILVYTGYKLSAPKVFKDASIKGYEQLLIVVVTLFATLVTDLNRGIFMGILFTIVVHLIRSLLPASTFFRTLSKPSIHLAKIEDHYHVKLKGIANFTALISLKRMLKDIPSKQKVVFDFSNARLVDFSLLECVSEWGEAYTEEKNGIVETIGLDEHITTSPHPFTIHSLPQKLIKPLSNRQQILKDFCDSQTWSFIPYLNWNISSLRKNKFFKTRPIEYSKNKIGGTYSNGITWEVNDITFDEGALMAAEVHNTTMLRIYMNKDIPDFEMEREGLFNRLLDYAIQQDVNFEEDKDFDSFFSVKSPDRQGVKALFTPELQRFMNEHKKYHVESSDNVILVFRYFRILSIDEIQSLVDFGDKLTNSIKSA